MLTMVCDTSAGAQMVLAMKLISLAFDLDTGALQELPSLLEYSGYVFHVGSVIFGPWVPYQDYAYLTTHTKDRKMVSLCWCLTNCPLKRMF